MNESDPDPAGSRFQLRLFVAGNTARSHRAIENLRHFCAAHLAGRCDVEVVDIYQQPELAELSQVVAVPTLLRMKPLPVRRIVGDLSQSERVRRGLGLIATINEPAP